jgi:hypothetical protein
MADLETVKKYRPSALAITVAETKETLFKVGFGSGSVSDYGISLHDLEQAADGSHADLRYGAECPV